jgi:hypothetical protein
LGHLRHNDKAQNAIAILFVFFFWAIPIYGWLADDWGTAGYAFLAFLGACAVFGMLLGGGSGSGSSPIKSNTSPIATSITIARPASVVWDALLRAERWREWWPSGVIGVSPRWSKGATLTWEAGGTSTVSRFKPQREIYIDGGSVEMRITLVERGGSTSVELEEAPIRGSRWTDGGFSRLYPMSQALEGLKQMVEGG